MQDILAQILAELRTALASDVSRGVLAAAVIASVLAFAGYQLRSAPAALVALVRSQFTVTLTIGSDSPVFHLLTLWLARHPDLKRARRLTVAAWWAPSAERAHLALTAGEGTHLIRHGGRWFLLERERESGGANGSTRGDGAPPAPAGGVRSERMQLVTWGRSRAPFEALVAELSTMEEDVEAITVQQHGMGAMRRTRRSLDTIDIDPALKAEIVGDVELFASRRDWYVQRGVPWRRGYMLHGPPGTGKSSLIFALASHLGKPVFIVNPATISNDGELLYAINCRPGSIIVLEDVDSIEILKARPDLEIAARQDRERRVTDASDAITTPVGARAAAVVRETGTGLTLSGFLNAIDGVGATEGRILFMTSNTPEALDPALMRPGRIDRAWQLGPAGIAEATAMHRRFYPDRSPAPFIARIAHRLPMPQAEVQDLLLAEEECDEIIAPAAAAVQGRAA